MLTKQELEDLIKAWPDENGETNDPDTYFNWLEKQRRYFAGVVWHALGRAKIEALSERQKNLLNNALERLLRKKTVFEITDAEILGQYEMITEHVSPLWQEKVVSEFYEKQTFH
jgi:DNA-binding SARP family transcriptional activator